MITYMAFLLMGILDRLRGDEKDIFGRWFDKLAYAYVTAILLGHYFDTLTAPIIVGLFIGMSISWGKPIGDILNPPNTLVKYHYWQVGIFKKPYYALAFRGFLWGALLIPLTYFDIKLLVVSFAYAFAMPLALYLVRNMKDKNKAWEMQEILRGYIAGLIIFFVCN